MAFSILLVAGMLLALAAALAAGVRVVWALAGCALAFACLGGDVFDLWLAGERALAALRATEWPLVPLLCWLAALLDETGARGLARALPGAAVLALLAFALALPWLDLLLASALPLLGVATLHAAVARFAPGARPAFAEKLAPIGLLGAGLGLVLTGRLAPVEASALVALAVCALAGWRGQLGWDGLRRASWRALLASGAVAAVLLAAAAFGEVLRAAGFESLTAAALGLVAAPSYAVLLGVLALVLGLGAVFCASELALIVVPLAAPLALSFGADRLWLAAALMVGLQASRFPALRGFLDPARRAPPLLARLAFPCLVQVAMFRWPELVRWLPEAILS